MAYTDIDKPGEYFNTVLYSGNNTSQSVTGVGFQPDWVWLKERNGTEQHNAYDSVRGVYKRLMPDANSLEYSSDTQLTVFGSDGFSVGSSDAINDAGNSMVAWNWKKSATPGFDIVTATGTGSAKTIAHSLSAVPHVIISKEKSGSVNDWVMYHESLGNTKKVILNEPNAVSTDSCWNNTTPTSSVFSVSGASVVNRNSSTYVYYLFSEKKGYSKFGSFVSNNTSDNAFIYTGFKPAFLIAKSTTSANNWVMFDNTRNTFNPVDKKLYPDLGNAEDTEADWDFLSNGLKLRAGAGANTFIYLAFAENPFTTSTGIPATAR
tara:strand:- start:5 stop:964 length:960 start_codon:yes stop_codon:yes gene_type:complete